MYRRTRAMILLAAYAGLRVSEIAAIKGDDVDTVINTVTVIRKGDKERQIPLHAILKDLATVMPQRGWWFPTYIGNTKHRAGGPMLGNSVSSSISSVMDRAGIPGTPHASATGSAPPSEKPASTPWSSKNSWATNRWPPQPSTSTCRCVSGARP